MKKVLALICSIILIISLNACTKTKIETTKDNTGVSKENTSDVSTEIGEVDYPDTFSVWTSMHPNAAPVVSDLNEVLAMQEMEKITGTKVEFQIPPIGQEKEQFNLLITAGHYPDVIGASWNEYPGGPDKAGEDGVIISLKDMIDEVAPNIKAILEANPDLAKQWTTESGEIYILPRLLLEKYNTFGGFMFNQTYLDQINMETPETIDEWTKVLRAFKNKLGLKKPFTIRLKELLYTSKLEGAFGISLSGYQRDGKFKYAQLEPEFKEFIETLKMWYEEGLIDPDFAIASLAEKDANIINGDSGAFFGYIGGGMGKYTNAVKGKYQFTAVQYPVLNKGDEPEFTLYRPEIILKENAFAITTACKNPKEVLKWFDYWYGDEGYVLKNFGIEGTTYNMVEGKHIYSDLIIKNPDGLAIANAMAKYFFANYPFSGRDSDEYLMQYYTLPEQQEALNVYRKYTDNAKKVLLPVLTFTNEELDEMNPIKAELNTYSDEMVAKFIMGIEPIENFDKYIQTLKTLGAERYIEINQAALDRYNAQ